MNRRAVGSLLLIVAMGAWAAWLVSKAKSKADYVVERAESVAPLPACEWVAFDAPAVASLGFSQDPGHAWSDRATAYLAVNPGAIPEGGWLDLDVAAVAQGETWIDIDGGARYVVRKGKAIRMPVPALEESRVLLVAFTANDLLPPHGAERRWLGVAISRLRVCPR